MSKGELVHPDPTMAPEPQLAANRYARDRTFYRTVSNTESVRRGVDLCMCCGWAFAEEAYGSDQKGVCRFCYDAAQTPAEAREDAGDRKFHELNETPGGRAKMMRRFNG